MSNIDLTIHIDRFDKELSSLTPQNLATQAPILKAKYDPFYTDYMSQILLAGATNDTSYYSNLRTVLTNKDYIELSKVVNSTYPDLKESEEQLTDAFKHILYFYPKQKIPKFISFLSGFSVQIPIGNNYVGIGLDMFLGADSKFYPALVESIPNYISRRFTTDNITPRVVEAFCREDMFPEPDDAKSLLAKMIYNGKVMYFLDEVMPNTPDSLKIGYSQKQVEWVNNYEADIWGYFLEENLIYNTDYLEIQKYLTEAPFTPGIGENNESAPKLGIWTGWQIVKHFMDKNPDITVQQLMQEKDYQKILTKSSYKPK